MKNTEATKTVEAQLVKAGREHPIWSVNIKVNGRSVESVNFPSKRAAWAALPDLANKHR